MNKRSFIFVIALTITFYLVNQFFFPSKPVPPTHQETVSEPVKKEKAAPTAKEDYYVLENPYQQLVFSNVGGALAEINLPLASKKDTSSIVLPTEFDRTFTKEQTANDHFPAFGYKVNRGSGVESVQKGHEGGYYPLLRRTLFRPRNPASFKSPTHYYALRVISQSEGSRDLPFQLKELNKDSISFEYSDAKRRVTKTFSFVENAPYCVDVSLDVQGDASDLFLTTGVPEVELISGSAAPSLSYVAHKPGRKRTSTSISLPKECTVSETTELDWICNSNGFFGLILDPLSANPAGYRACKVQGTQDPTRLSLIEPEYSPYPAEDYPGYECALPLDSGTTSLRYFAGPLQIDLLRQIDKALTDPGTKVSPQYTLALSFHGWFTFISEPFAQFLFVLMNFFHTITTSWGISIILLTVALRLMLYPLNAWSIKSTLKMQEVAPRVSAVQEKWKKEPKKAQMEIMMLYKQAGVNPLSGCFPLLIQLPFLIGMFDLLKSSFELRGASFIPGWIDNLSAPDVLFSWHYHIPFFGSEFHLLPFILGAVMWLQQRFSSSLPKDTSNLTDQQKQQKMMGNVMTVVFTVMFYNFPSGLNLYWLSSMSLGILQQWWMMKKLKPKQG